MSGNIHTFVIFFRYHPNLADNGSLRSLDANIRWKGDAVVLKAGKRDNFVHLRGAKEKLLAAFAVKRFAMRMGFTANRRTPKRATIAAWGKGPLISILMDELLKPVYAIAVSRHLPVCHIALVAGSNVFLAAGDNAEFRTIALLRPFDLQFDGEKTCGRSLHFVERDKKLIVSYLHHGIFCWDVATLSRLWQILPGPTQNVAFSAISPDEKEIAVSNYRMGVDIYSTESLVKTRSYADDIPIMLYYDLLSVNFLANGRFVTMGSHNGQVRIWDKHTGKIVQTLEHDQYLVKSIAECTFQDVEMLAAASVRDDFYIQLWVSKQTKPKHPFYGHYRAVLLVLFLSWTIGVFLAVRQLNFDRVSQAFSPLGDAAILANLAVCRMFAYVSDEIVPMWLKSVGL
ncbi:hypothetical protein F5887DRAFT_1072489 [Amanita rubescens]|nr:hypothetical protein F5887DRAFT_1072489 [Amanita rubescens]